MGLIGVLPWSEAVLLLVIAGLFVGVAMHTRSLLLRVVTLLLLLLTAGWLLLLLGVSGR